MDLTLILQTCILSFTVNNEHAIFEIKGSSVHEGTSESLGVLLSVIHFLLKPTPHLCLLSAEHTVCLFHVELAEFGLLVWATSIKTMFSRNYFKIVFIRVMECFKHTEKV